jgi:hypothetical protein
MLTLLQLRKKREKMLQLSMRFLSRKDLRSLGLLAS